jgi:uroporphyrin-III C-methyltransferase
VRAVRVLAEADVVAYDELVSPEVLALAPKGAELVPVGRRAQGCRHHEARIHPVIVLRALEGKTVVRLKGGDPYVFGRGGEEAEELACARVPFEVVPGISAALGAAASTHIPLTHREASSLVTFATAHAAKDDEDSGLLAARLPKTGTVVLYMGLGRIEETCAALVASGRAASTPAAVISRATLPDERTVTGTLADIVARAREAALPAPALLVVGEVVARRVESPAMPRSEACASTRSS